MDDLRIECFERTGVMIGSGIGGPARFIANQTKSKIYAIEIQEQLNNIAKRLTIKYKLDNNINHINTDILNYNFQNLKFTNIVSWLAMYHIPNRTKLLKIISNVLHNNGYLYSEDFYLKKNLNNTEEENLARLFHANHLVSYECYLRELVNNNFKVLEIQDMSENWTFFTKNGRQK